MQLVAAQLGSLKDVLVVADALHAQTGHAELLAVAGGHLMVAVKGNQPKLFAQLKALPWAQVPVGDQTRDTGHGRKETRTVKAITIQTPGGLGFPHAQQAVRITRTRTIKGRTTRETAYLTVSLPAEQAQPADLGTWARSEWHIENRLHYVRDVTLREDAHQTRTGNGPAVFATLRNTSIGYHRTNGATNIAEATRRANHRPHGLIDAVTRSNPTTSKAGLWCPRGVLRLRPECLRRQSTIRETPPRLAPGGRATRSPYPAPRSPDPIAPQSPGLQRHLPLQGRHWLNFRGFEGWP